MNQERIAKYKKLVKIKNGIVLSTEQATLEFAKLVQLLGSVENYKNKKTPVSAGV